MLEASEATDQCRTWSDSLHLALFGIVLPMRTAKPPGSRQGCHRLDAVANELQQRRESVILLKWTPELQRYLRNPRQRTRARCLVDPAGAAHGANLPWRACSRRCGRRSKGRS